MDDQLTLAGTAIERGRHQIIRIPVTVDLDGGEIALTVHAIAGARPGPTLLLTGIQHGDEWQELELFQRILHTIDPATIGGTVVLVPVCSPPALGQLTRVTQYSSDGPDLNRVYPGKFNWIPELIAKTITREILPSANAIIDYHFGIWGSGIGFVAYGSDYPDSAVSEQSRALAFAYGHALINAGSFMGGFPGPSSMVSYAGAQLGIPALVGEIGVTGFGRAIEDHWLEVNLNGVRGVMQHLGMLDGTPAHPDRTLVFTRSQRVEPTKGGLLVPTRARDELGREVRAGEELARVVSPYTFETLETLVAPFDGVLILVARCYPVRPGDWAFAVASTDTETSTWVSGTGVA